jgi:outer membrane scaffolding protein for murein synthesis (MipA/OmpV family)
MIISETPDAGPQSKRLSVVVGLGASVGPAYAGSAVTRVAPIPYVDVRGLLGGCPYVVVNDILGCDGL